MSTETSDLLQSLLRTQLIDETGAKRLGASSVADIAQELESTGVLNHFQADRIATHQSLFVGDYVLRQPIGQGGMGTLYEAWHPHLDRLVVLKSIATHLPDQAELRRRFKRELQACGQLSHPNVVTVHDAVIDDHCPWLVMEKLEGSDLGTVVAAQGRLPESASVAIGIQAARGLDHAHHHGILHRDVKPSNLFLTHDSQVRVLDFGLAFVRQLGEEDNELMTKTGVTLGTAAFMAPEQAINSHHADVRSDVYSLGCTLYYLLAAKPPYRGKTTVEQILAHREQDVPKLPAQICAATLSDILGRMMSKDPNFRQQSMQEVIDDLSCLADRSTSHQSISLPSLSTLPPLPPVDQTPIKLDRCNADAHDAEGRATVRINTKLAGGVAALLVIVALGWMAISDWTSDWQSTTGPPSTAFGGRKSDLADDSWPALRQALQQANPRAAIPIDCYANDHGMMTINLKGISELAKLVPLGELKVDALDISMTTISDLSQLSDSRLNWIDVGETAVTDLSPLAGLPLAEVACYSTSVDSLEPLRGMNLARIDIHQTQVDDLSPLVGMTLSELDMHQTRVSELSPLSSIPLSWLDCQGAPVSSLDPVRSCPLQYLNCDAELLQDIDIRQSWPALETLNEMSVERWLERRQRE